MNEGIIASIKLLSRGFRMHACVRACMRASRSGRFHDVAIDINNVRMYIKYIDIEYKFRRIFYQTSRLI